MSRYVGKHEGGPGKAAAVTSAEDSGRAAAGYVQGTDFLSDFETASSAAEGTVGAKRKKGGRITGFRRFLLIYSAVFLLLIAVGLAFFWKYIAAFEVSRPEHTMDGLMLAIKNDDDCGTLGKLFKVSEFENRDAVFSDVCMILKGSDCSYRKLAGEYTDDAPVYVIRTGTTDLLKASLAPKGDGSAGYGFSLWEISEVGILDKNTRTEKIEAPPGARVEVNGIEVPDSYITGDHIAYGPDESRFNAGAYRVLYSVGGLYDEPKVSAFDENGEELTKEDSGDNGCAFDPDRLSVKIVAPSDASVTLNGIRLSEQDASGTLFSPELFKGLEKYAGKAPDFTIYEADGLLGSPEIEVRDASGQELTESGEWDGELVFGLSEDERLKQEHTGTVTGFIKKYVSFSSNEGNDPNGNFYRLSQCLLKGTDTYKRFADSVEGLAWVRGGTVTYDELGAGGFISCGEDCFICTASMDITVNVSGGARETKGAYTLVFVRSGGAWLVGNMVSQ